MAVIVDAGIREMMVEQKDVFYYVTLMNENYAQPSLPPEAHADVLRGCYLLGRFPEGSSSAKVTLMGSGAILTEVVKAAHQLAAAGIATEVFSVTSWSELARDGQACEAADLGAETGGSSSVRTPFVAQQLGAGSAPIVAATDYVRAVPESVRAFLPQGRSFVTLGTDGFGRSDTRAALRGLFGVDAASIVRAARHSLAKRPT